MQLSKLGVLVLLMSGVFINGIDRTSISAAAPLIIKEYHLDPGLMGIILSAFFWPYTLLQFPLGRLADVFGARRVLGWSATLWSLASTGTGMAPNFVSLIACRIGVGVGEAAAIPTSNKVVIDNFDSKDRGMAVGWYQASLRLSYAMAPLLMAFLISTWGWREAFYITGVGSLLWCGLWFFAYKETLPRDSGKKLSDSWRGVPWREFLGNRSTLGLMLAKFCQDYLTYLFITWLPGYLVLERGFSILKMGIYASLPWLAGCFAQVAIGYLSDWLIKRGVGVSLARKGVQVVALLCGATVIGVNYISDPMTAVYLLIFCVGIQAGAGGHFFAMLAEVAPPKMAGSLSGIANTAGAFAGILSPIVTGYIVKTTGSFSLALATGGVLVLLAAATILFIIPELKPIQLSTTKQEA